MSFKNTIESFFKATQISKVATCTLESFSYSQDVANLQKAVEAIFANLLGARSRHVCLAFDEIVRNAYEHGNLEITGPEKNSLLNAEGLEVDLKKREGKFGKRKIRVLIELNEQVLKVTVEDEGPGFDWKGLSLSLTTDSLHGRGIPIIKSAVDKVSYNKKGNACTIEILLA